MDKLFKRLGTSILLCLSLFLSSCSGIESFYAYGYYWEPNPYQIDCDQVTWIPRSQKEVTTLCGDERAIGCVYYDCMVVSVYTEEDAKTAFKAERGQSHYDHEVEMHIRRKLRHPSEH